MPTKQLFNFLSTVRSYYHIDNPYHNFKHAFCVAHTTFLLLKQHGLQLLLPQTEVPNWRHNYNPLRHVVAKVLAMFLAAICHDIDHPGYRAVD